METSVKEAIEASAAASKAGTIHFGEAVRQLMNAGVESYYADYRAGMLTYYLPNGETHAVGLTAAGELGTEFNAEAVLAAIRGAQRGEVMYPAFVAKTVAAGCVGYMVWIAGRHVTYFGRRGETHVERFPGT